MNLKNSFENIVKNFSLSGLSRTAAGLAALRRWLLSRKGWKTLAVIAALLVMWLTGMLDSIADAVQIFSSSAIDPSAFAAAVIPAVAGVAGASRNIDGEPLTTAIVENEAPSLLRNEIDSRIVRIRPMSTPLDQISRYGGARQCRSMKVEYYSVDTKPVTVLLADEWTAPDERTITEEAPATLKISEARVFQRSTTVLVPEVMSSSGDPLVLYVTDSDGSAVTAIAVNNTTEAGTPFVPTLKKGTKLVRMGRAAAELDVTTPQFETLPTKAYNLCQIFKAQVEQSTFVKIANKEVGWSFSDQEEAAIIDMRMGMEKNFLMGHRCRLTIPSGEEIMLTGGIWNQTQNDYTYSEITSENDLVALCKQAFQHNAGSSRKILLAGSDLIEALHKIDRTRVISSEKAVTKWGLDFTEIHSKFGTLYVLLSEVFDQCGMAANGMVVDPEYITKYSHVPFRTERLDLKAAGVRNTDAIVITEASCLVLRYPQTHMRIIKA